MSADRPTRFARAQRGALADALEQAGPEAPTLCDGWTTRDLAAHVILRERRPDAAPGIMVPALAGWTARVGARIARRDYATLVGQVRSGPRFSPLALGPLDEATNLTEFFVHTEDVLRAQPDWRARPIGDDLAAALWQQLRRHAARALRSQPYRITLSAPGHGTRTSGEGPAVTVSGAPGELMLFVVGRQAVADVELTGPLDALTTLRGARLGV